MPSIYLIDYSTFLVSIQKENNNKYAHVFVFNVPSKAKTIRGRGHRLVSSNRLEKSRVEPVTPS